MTRFAPYIIAEMACSHEGDATLAQKIIDAAAQAGADAIQFQIWLAQDMAVPHHAAYPHLTRLELSREAWAQLATYTRTHYPGLHIIGCVYEPASVDFCQHIGVDAYKLHAADLANPAMITYTAATGQRIDLSIGASTLDEVQQAITWINETPAASSDIWLMYGYQNFPTPTDQVHLRFMQKLKHLFEKPIGYQDHSDAESEAAFWLPAAALGMGVDILEKHITHDRAYKGADHEAALNPDEFTRFVQMVRTLDAALGTATPRSLSAEEHKYRRYARKSLVARHDIPAGSCLTADDLLAIRADPPGLSPDKASYLIGRETRQSLTAYQTIQEEYVA